MRQSLHSPTALGRKLVALVCFLAVVLLWSPLWAAAWQANTMACCNDGLCPAHGKPASSIPEKQQSAAQECEHQGGSQHTGNMNCSMSCCHETPVSFTTAILFLLPEPTILSQPAQSVATVSVLAASKCFQSLEPLAPPPRASFYSL